MCWTPPRLRRTGTTSINSFVHVSIGVHHPRCPTASEGNTHTHVNGGSTSAATVAWSSPRSQTIPRYSRRYFVHAQACDRPGTSRRHPKLRNELRICNQVPRTCVAAAKGSYHKNPLGIFTWASRPRQTLCLEMNIPDNDQRSASCSFQTDRAKPPTAPTHGGDAIASECLPIHFPSVPGGSFKSFAEDASLHLVSWILYVQSGHHKRRPQELHTRAPARQLQIETGI